MSCLLPDFNKIIKKILGFQISPKYSSGPSSSPILPRLSKSIVKILKITVYEFKTRVKNLDPCSVQQVYVISYA